MKKIINLITFLLVVCFVVQSSSCSKTDEPQIHCDSSNTALIPADARSRFCFKESTWWVYKNIANGDLDTLTFKLEGYAISSVPQKIYGSGYSKCYEGISYNIFSKKYPKVNVKIAVNWPTKGINIKEDIFEYRELFSSIDFTSRSSLRFKWKYQSLDSISDGLIDTIPKLTIFDKIYTDVIHYSYKQGFEAKDYLKESWYANKVGLIKVVREDGTTWELINSYIIQ
jgi:hypothetical protein